MPHVLIETRREYSEAEEVALIDAVHGALQRAFRIPPEDRHVRLLAHLPHRFAVPPGTSQPDRFTLVSIDAFAGRSLDAKRDLYRQIVESLEPLGIRETTSRSSCATSHRRVGGSVAALPPPTSTSGSTSTSDLICHRNRREQRVHIAPRN